MLTEQLTAKLSTVSLDVAIIGGAVLLVIVVIFAHVAMSRPLKKKAK